MRYVAGNAQSIGARERQEDSFGFTDPAAAEFVRHGGFAGVLADGMGGLLNGRQASRAAVQAFLTAYSQKPAAEPISDALQRAVLQANRAVLQAAIAGDATNQSGSTLVAAAASDRSLYWISVGDSEIYLWRAGHLTRLNQPHTYAQDLDRRAAHGELSREEALRDADREALTSYLGQDSPRHIDRNVSPFPLQPGDQVVLCSDGVSKSLTADQMVQAMHSSPQRSCEALLERVLAAGVSQQDNATVLSIAVDALDSDGAAVNPSESLPLRAIDRRPALRSRYPAAIALAMLLAAGALLLVAHRYRAHRPLQGDGTNTVSAPATPPSHAEAKPSPATPEKHSGPAPDAAPARQVRSGKAAPSPPKTTAPGPF
jgi:serine/threonine protein phosphatase PrpC